MKKIVYLMLAVVLSIAAQAQSDTPYLTKSLSKESIKDVYARTSGGGITIAGGPESEARIEVYITGNNNQDLSKDEIKKRLDEDYDLEVSASGGKLTVTAEPRHNNMNWKRALNISFKVYAPKNVSTDLATSGGGIDLSNLAGSQKFSTSGGGLNIDKLSGKIYGRTSGGGIDVSNSTDDIDLSTSGGGINASNCTGNMKLNTSGGSLDLTELQGKIEARTSGGGVHGNNIKGELVAHTSGGSVSLRDIAGSVDTSTSGGNMDIEIDELGKYFTASNSGGNIKIKLPGNKGLDLKLRAENIRIESLTNFTGDKDEHRVTGTINGGGVPVDVHTSGTITLGFK